MNVFEYLDYREFLKDFYTEQKKENLFISYRYIGRKLNLDPGFLVRILQGKFHLSSSKINLVSKLCKFNLKEAEYFENLVYFGKSKTQKDGKIYFEKLISLQDVKTKKLVASQYEYYKEWYYTAVRALLNCAEGKSYSTKELASKLSPAITTAQVKKAIQLLKELSLIEEKEKGVYTVTEKHVTTGKEFHSLAVKNFQKEVIQLAADSLDRHHKSIRDIATLTVSADEEALEDIKEMAREFRQAVKKRIERVESPNRIFQLNTQLFPLSEIIRGKK